MTTVNNTVIKFTIRVFWIYSKDWVLMKKCKCCGEILPINEFRVHKWEKFIDHRYSYCKNCEKEIRKVKSIWSL